VNANQINCLQNYQGFFYDDASLVGKCYNYCPIECTEVQYELTLSSSSYPTVWYAEVLTNNSKFNNVINAYFTDRDIPFINYTGSFNELKNSISRINVYYEDLRFVHIEDNEAMNILSLLGTLGGDLGLFLGIFDYFLYFIIDDICW
jgi:hypothetical protein